jgi:hypothetical protein
MILAMNVLSFALLAMTGVTADGLVRALFYHPAWFLLVCSIITLCPRLRPAPFLMGLKAMNSGNPPGYSEFWADTPPPYFNVQVLTNYLPATYYTF